MLKIAKTVTAKPNKQTPLLSAFFLFILLISPVHSSWAQAADTNMTENETIIREFVAAWSNLDADELATYFTEDGTYYNMPTQPISGRENVRDFIANFMRPWESTEWEILNLLVEGDIVMVERVDHTVALGNNIDLPCLGYFLMEDGKIKMWRDYFDLATYTSALSPQ
jgi:limonene-1,2-epoxide hydrolase